MIQTNLTGATSNLPEENIAKLKQIFPDVFEEGKINFERLRQDLGGFDDGGESDRYRFTWHGKAHALCLAQTPGMGTLRPCVEESSDWDTTKNLYIEGDNLEVLKLLQKSYCGGVKMIYIDPPYNTGNDFIYPDDFRDSLTDYLELTGQAGRSAAEDDGSESGGRYHTKWLNMIYPRLWLARNLLTDDGVIFISIDDNEIDNLKKVCNEVFGEENYINLISLKTKTSSGASGGGEDKRLKKNNEYIFIYAKTKSSINLKQPIEKVKISDFIQQHRENKVGFYYTRILEDAGEKELLCEMDEMKLYAHRNFLFSTVQEKRRSEGLTQDEVYHKYFDRIFMVTNAQTSLLGKVNQVTPQSGMLVSYEYTPKTGRNRGKHTVKYIWNKTLIVWLADSAEKGNRFVYKYENLGTLWDDISWGRLDLQGGVPFKNGKKPLKLLERILSMAAGPDSVVLDFFSGSATTAHAVLQANAQDGGNRRFIMVQLPEPTDEKDEALKVGYRNICEIGKERIRRAGEKIKSDQLGAENREAQQAPGGLDVGFKVLKLDSSNLKKWNPDYTGVKHSQNVRGSYVPGRTELDVVYEIMLKCGLMLTCPVEQIKVPGTNSSLYCMNHGALVICLDENITADAVNKMVRLNRELQPEGGMRAVFQGSGFESDGAKTDCVERLKAGGIAEWITL